MNAHSPTVGMIWAEAHGGVIGRDGTMPWHVPEDLTHFATTTGGHPVVMGRRTWESLPEAFRPLPGRMNIVVTRDAEYEADGAVVVHSVEAALAAGAEAEITWVIGGGAIYREVESVANALSLTQLDLDVEGDTHAPSVDDTWQEVARDPESGWHTSRTGIRYLFRTLVRQ